MKGQRAPGTAIAALVAALCGMPIAAQAHATQAGDRRPSIEARRRRREALN
jgi:hypothetical protein